MYYLYYVTNSKHNLVKIGITRGEKRGYQRAMDYARRHGLPSRGWSSARHYKLNTDSFAQVRAIESAIHAAVGHRTVFVNGQPLREVFKCTPSTAHYAILPHVRRSEHYEKQ